MKRKNHHSAVGATYFPILYSIAVYPLANGFFVSKYLMCLQFIIFNFYLRLAALGV